MATGGRQSNQVGKMGVSSGAGGMTWRAARRLDLEAFDRLHPALRRRINENNLKISSDSVLRYFVNIDGQIQNPARTLLITMRKIDTLEENEIQVFSGEHKAEFGYPLPHVAAQATILRYGALGARTRHRRPRITGFGLTDDTEAA
jgi:hypothetical protein